jgi:hypothetical protein
MAFDIELEAGEGGVVAERSGHAWICGVGPAAVKGGPYATPSAASPLILRKEIYVTAALAGAAAFVGRAALGAPAAIAAAAGFVACFLIRARALHHGWSLPVYRAREGRTMEEVEGLGRE